MNSGGKRRRRASCVHLSDRWRRKREEFGLWDLGTAFKICPAISWASPGAVVLQWLQAWEGTLASFSAEVLGGALGSHAEPGWSLLAGSGPRHCKNPRNKGVWKGTISYSWLKCVYVKPSSVTKTYWKWMPATAFGLPAIKHRHKTVSRAMSSRPLWHNCIVQLTGNEGLPKSTCSTPCFVMGFCTVAGIKKN